MLNIIERIPSIDINIGGAVIDARTNNLSKTRKIKEGGSSYSTVSQTGTTNNLIQKIEIQLLENILSHNK